MIPKLRTHAGLIALLLGATGIGFAPILVRWSEVGPSATAAFRVLLAMPLLWLWVVMEQRSSRARRKAEVPRTSTSGSEAALATTLSSDIAGRMRRADLLCLAAAGACFAADLGLWHWSLQLTSVANSTLLINLTPVLVAVAAWKLWGERLPVRLWLGLAAAFGGIVLLLANSIDLGRAHVRGDGLALVTTVFYAAYLLFVKQLRRTHSTAVVMAWSSVAMVPVAFLFAWAAGETLWPNSASGWSVLLVLALVSQAGGQVLIAFGLGRLPASVSSVTLLWQPVVAALAAWVLLGEMLTTRQGAGALAVLVGIALATRRS